MKTILVLTEQPPGTNGVQAIRYQKLSCLLLLSGYRLIFIGPNPRLASVYSVSTGIDPSSLQYVNSILPSRLISVMRHRRSRLNPFRLILAGVQGLLKAVEQLFHIDGDTIQLLAIKKKALDLVRKMDITAIAGISPSFKILDLAWQIHHDQGLPLISIYDDPFGARSIESGFIPALPDDQARIINSSLSTIFASPTTLRNYLDLGLVESSKAAWVSDCYPMAPRFERSQYPSVISQGSKHFEIVHLGNLAEWRPIDSLLTALERINYHEQARSIYFANYGLVYKEAKKTVNNSPTLKEFVTFLPAMQYYDSHNIASHASVLAVVVGPRHADNLPSKFFEYLGHRKPILLIAPVGHYLCEVVSSAGIGVSADVLDAEAIRMAIDYIYDHYEGFCIAYDSSDVLNKFSSAAIASSWSSILDKAMS